MHCVVLHVKFALVFVFEMVCFIFSIKVERKAQIRNRYNQVPQLTQDTIQESDKHRRKHNSQESQEVSPFPASDCLGCKKQTRQHIPDKHETLITKTIHKRSTALEQSVKSQWRVLLPFLL